jgi:uncharacterized membrane protein
VSQEHPLVERYLARLRDGLSVAPAPERDEVLNDIRSHVAEAVAAGTPLDQVLTSLGPADQLARAYRVELLLNPTRGRKHMFMFQRFLSLASIVAVTSIPTLVIVTVLSAVTISLLFSGAVVFLAGLLNGLGGTLPLSGVEGHRMLAVATGLLLLLVGASSLWALYQYLRWLAGVLRRRIPAHA